MTANIPDFFSDMEEEQTPDFFSDLNNEFVPKEDLVSKDLREQGYEPDFGEEIERLQERGGSEFAKGLIHSATTGGLLSHLTDVPEKEKSKGRHIGEFTGSLVPIEGISAFWGPKLLKLASQSPVFKRSVQALARLTGMGLTGATYEGAEKLNKGEIPKAEEIFKHGGQWALIDAIIQTAGLGGRFTKALLNKTKKTGKPTFEVLNDLMNDMREQGVGFTPDERTATKALSILEGSTEKGVANPPSLPLGTKKVSQEHFTKISEKSPELAEPIQPKQMHQPPNEDNLIKEAIEENINKISPKKVTKQEFGKGLQEIIENRFKEEEALYKPLYNQVEEGSKKINYSPDQTMAVVKKGIDQIKQLKTKPEGYNKVLSQLEDILSDLGYHETAKIGGSEFKLNKPIYENIPVSKLIELGRRLNKIIDYDIVGSGIKDKLKPVVRSIKEEIRHSLELNNPELSKVFDQAEKKYGETAQKFGRESIYKARGKEEAEKVNDAIKSPTMLDDLKSILKPDQMRQVERQMLEHLDSLSLPKATEYMKEMGSKLSPDSRKIAQDIIDHKIPKSITRSGKIKDLILNDIGAALETGQRPKKTLDLWKTVKGQDLIKNALKDNPNKKEILDYLQKQSFYDFTSSFIEKNGTINFDKFNEVLKDPAVKSNIKMIGGDSAVEFFNNLEMLASKQKSNLSIFEDLKTKGKELQKDSPYGESKLVKAAKLRHPIRFKAKEFLENIGLSTQTAIKMLGALQLGIPTSAGAYVGYKVLYKFANNPKARRAYINAVNKKPLKTSEFINAYKHLDDELED